MLSKAKPLKLIGHWRPRKITKYIDGIYHAYGVSICDSFCNMTESPKIDDDSPTVTESPELPVWFKFSEKENPLADDPEDDFVLPTDSYWAANRRIQDQKTHIKHMVGVIVDSDVDRVSKILKNQYSSFLQQHKSWRDMPL